MDCSMPGFPVHDQLLELVKLMSIESVMPSNHLILCHPLLLPSTSASGSFPMSQLFALGGQSTEASASGSVLPMNIEDWFPLGLVGLIFLQSKGLWRVFSSTTVWKHQFFGAQPSLWSNSHIHTQSILLLYNRGGSPHQFQPWLRATSSDIHEDYLFVLCAENLQPRV